MTRRKRPRVVGALRLLGVSVVGWVALATANPVVAEHYPGDWDQGGGAGDSECPPAEPKWRGTQLAVEDAETMMRWILEVATIDSTFCVQEYRFVNKIRDFIGMTSKDYYRIQGEVEDICRRRLMAANSLS